MQLLCFHAHNICVANATIRAYMQHYSLHFVVLFVQHLHDTAVTLGI